MSKRPRVMRLTPELIERVPAYPGDDRQAPNSTLPPGHHEATADLVLKAAPSPDELWVFAFGALIWKPGTELDAASGRPGIVRGWHRAFCLGWDRYFRGSPENPNVVMSIDRGGQCRGVAYRLRTDGDGLRANLISLLSREPPIPPRWVQVKTTDGPLKAFAFAMSRSAPFYLGGLTTEQIVDAMSKASGHIGRSAEYLHNTVQHLEAMGIHDRHLWDLQERVAAKLEALPPAAKG